MERQLILMILFGRSHTGPLNMDPNLVGYTNWLVLGGMFAGPRMPPVSGLPSFPRPVLHKERVAFGRPKILTSRLGSEGFWGSTFNNNLTKLTASIC